MRGPDSSLLREPAAPAAIHAPSGEYTMREGRVRSVLITCSWGHASAVRSHRRIDPSVTRTASCSPDGDQAMSTAWANWPSSGP